MGRPPPSRGGHRRLNSIENDDWTESPNEEDPLLEKESEEEERLHSGSGRSKKQTGKMPWRRDNYGATGDGSDYDSSSVSSR